MKILFLLMLFGEMDALFNMCEKAEMKFNDTLYITTNDSVSNFKTCECFLNMGRCSVTIDALIMTSGKGNKCSTVELHINSNIFSCNASRDDFGYVINRKVYTAEKNVFLSTKNLGNEPPDLIKISVIPEDSSKITCSVDPPSHASVTISTTTAHLPVNSQQPSLSDNGTTDATPAETTQCGKCPMHTCTQIPCLVEVGGILLFQKGCWRGLVASCIFNVLLLVAIFVCYKFPQIRELLNQLTLNVGSTKEATFVQKQLGDGNNGEDLRRKVSTETNKSVISIAENDDKVMTFSLNTQNQEKGPQDASGNSDEKAKLLQGSISSDNAFKSIR